MPSKFFTIVISKIIQIVKPLMKRNFKTLPSGNRFMTFATLPGLTQQELADLVGTTASSICRLESADYEGHSLPMLRKVAFVLGQRVEIRFVPNHDSSMAGTH